MPKLLLVNPLYPNELKAEYEGSMVIIIVDPHTNKVDKVTFMGRERAQSWLETNAGRYGNKTMLLGCVSIVGEVFSPPAQEHQLGEPSEPTKKFVN